MLTYVQRELTFGDGIPLGALLAAKEISSINYLWSSRFCGAVMFKNDKGPRKRKKWIFLIPLMTISTILGVFVGPLSATLLIPRVDNWPAGGTAFWVNGTREELFPKRMEDNPLLAHCSLDTGDPSCPYSGWEIINQAYYAFWPRLEPMGSMPENIYMPSPYSHRHLGLRSRSNESEDGLYQSIWTGANSVATVPPSVVADSLAELGRLWSFAARNFDPGRKFWSHKDALFTVTVPEPIVQTQCISASNYSSNGSFAELSIPVMNASPDELESLQLHNQTVASMWAAGKSPNVLWLDDPNMKNRTNGTLNAVVGIPNAANGQSLLFACSVDSAIPDTNISTSRNLVKIVDGNALGYASTNGQFPKIDISSAWAKYLLPEIPNTNGTTIFTKIVTTAGLYNTLTPSHTYSYQFIIECILSTLIANGLGRASYNSTLLGHLRGYDPSNPWYVNATSTPAWLSHILAPGKKHMGFNDDPTHSAFDPLPPSLAAQSAMFVMRATVNGYAFSSSGRAAKASFAALITYIFLALCHVIYSIKTGWASTASDSSLEVAILAAGSKPTGRLKNTGAGTETIGVYEERVCIRDVEGRLELMWKDTEGGKEVRRIGKNKAYG